MLGDNVELLKAAMRAPAVVLRKVTAVCQEL